MYQMFSINLCGKNDESCLNHYDNINILYINGRSCVLIFYQIYARERNLRHDYNIFAIHLQNSEY